MQQECMNVRAKSHPALFEPLNPSRGKNPMTMPDSNPDLPNGSKSKQLQGVKWKLSPEIGLEHSCDGLWNQMLGLYRYHKWYMEL